VVSLAPAPGQPPPRELSLQRSLDALAGLGVAMVLTGALGPSEQEPYLATGFEEHARLHVLGRRLGDLEAPGTGPRLSRARRRDRQHPGREPRRPRPLSAARVQPAARRPARAPQAARPAPPRQPVTLTAVRRRLCLGAGATLLAVAPAAAVAQPGHDAPRLTLVSQTSWVGQGGPFDLRVKVQPANPAGDLDLALVAYQ